MHMCMPFYTDKSVSLVRKSLHKSFPKAGAGNKELIVVYTREFAGELTSDHHSNNQSTTFEPV